MNKRINSLHAWCLHWANTKWGGWALFFCAFAEASVLGLPAPMLFLALALLNIKKVFRYSLVGLVGTVSGSIAGYSIGHFAWIDAEGEFTAFAQFMMNNIPGFSADGYDKIHNLYQQWDFWVLFIAGSLPLPYKIFSISSGVFDVNIFIFCTATFISQGIKFFLLALLTIKLGPQVKKLLGYNWKPLAITALASIIIAIIITKVF